MTAPSAEELHRRVSDVEVSLAELQRAVVRLEVVLPSLQTDISDLKTAQARSDAARERQTEILSGKMDEVKEKAIGAVPPWASSTITVLAMGLAALLTAFFTR